MSDYELVNFTRGEALVSIWLAKIFTALSWGLWVIEVPAIVKSLASNRNNVSNIVAMVREEVNTEQDPQETDNLVENREAREEKQESLRAGFKFLAEMVNRLAFVLVTIGLTVAFCSTLLVIWVEYNQAEMSTIQRLEKDAHSDNMIKRARTVQSNEFMIAQLHAKSRDTSGRHQTLLRIFKLTSEPLLCDNCQLTCDGKKRISISFKKFSTKTGDDYFRFGDIDSNETIIG